MKRLLTFMYYDVKQPTAYDGIEQLYRPAKRRDGRVTNNSVRAFLKEHDTYTIHKKIRRRIPRNRTVVTAIDEQWQAYLVDVSQLAIEYGDTPSS